ncbi:hypothetical protein BS47DRAFT_1368399 [Hydnum rufescens UP504]|uniref:Uncharacterized protein n=1 Tax=Hydnum rufescens UP504 TaxID=1448309 RepID=A0A9P6DN70_9AGAM|nr:hypothetical protein BS47DRAFT_1368399 [Hydnum rufescens UP504]
MPWYQDNSPNSKFSHDTCMIMCASRTSSQSYSQIQCQSLAMSTKGSVQEVGRAGDAYGHLIPNIGIPNIEIPNMEIPNTEIPNIQGNGSEGPFCTMVLILLDISLMSRYDSLSEATQTITTEHGVKKDKGESHTSATLLNSSLALSPATTTPPTFLPPLPLLLPPDEAVEPTSPSTSHNSQSTLCLPPLHPIMSKCVRMPRQNPHMAIPHYVPSSQHEDILYHATTHECVAIPPRLRSMECYQEVTQRLDELVNKYTDPFSSAPITTYQFLMVWTKFAPAQYNQTYFGTPNYSANGNREATEYREGKLTEQLWMSKCIEELRMADKLLKLRVELTFVQLYKLRKLHQGETLSTPMASEDSLPPMPELRDRLHKAWHDPCLPTKKVARRALTTGWEAIQGDIEGMHPIITATRHPFSGNQALKFAEYNVNLEEALNMQPLPRVNTDPHGLGLFIPGSEFEEPSISASLGPDQGPRAGLGSIINLPAWLMPPSDQTRLGNSSVLWASLIDLDASPSNWQDIPLYDSTPRESDTPMQHPQNKLVAILQRVSTLGEGLQNALWTPSRSQVMNREPMGSWEMSPIGERTMGRHPSGDPLMLQPAGPSRACKQTPREKETSTQAMPGTLSQIPPLCQPREPQGLMTTTRI